MRPKLAGTLVVGIGLAIWGCGSNDPQSDNDQSPGTGGALGGTGGELTGGVGIGGASTGGYVPATGGFGGGSGGVGGSTGGSAPGGTGGEATGGMGGGATGGMGAGITGGAGGGAAGGMGGNTGGMSGSTGGTGGSAAGTGGSAGTPTGGMGGAGAATGGAAGTGGATGGSTSTDSPGCGTPVSRPNPDVQQTMDIDGTTRYYLLHVPTDADNQTPLMLIFGLHGYDMNNVAVAGLYNFTERSNGQAITVLPYGEGPPPGDVSHWGDHVLESTWQNNDANYKFIQTLMTDLENRFCIDTRRVFVAGFSMGGFFTNNMACDHSDWFRAFAPIAGGGPMACADGAQPAIMIHHGTADDIVEISSGEQSRDFWVEQNGCAQTTAPSYDGCSTYDGCPEASPVIWCVGNWNHTISATAAGNIWAFFSGLQ